MNNNCIISDRARTQAEPNDISVNPIKGKSYTLKCKVLESKPSVATYKWYKDNGEIQGKNTETLLIEGLDPVKDNGDYACAGYNGLAWGDKGYPYKLQVWCKLQLIK